AAAGVEAVVLETVEPSQPGALPQAEEARTFGPSPIPDADSLACVIYTSGSTGTPKGTLLGHRGLSNIIAWHRAAYEVTAADRGALLAGPGFDASVWDVWPYLTAGASVWIPPADVPTDPPALLRGLADHGVTLCFLSTPLAEAVMAEPLPAHLALRSLLTGGDRLVRRPPAAARFTLVNHYGPTETTLVVTAGPVAAIGEGGKGGERAPSIGRPLRGARVSILDDAMQPVPVGVPGEIWIGGVGLARGYLGRPDLTAEAFRPGPSEPRLYRTGDLARYLPDGAIEFLGRRDHQVKIRGIRIEPGEIEAALLAHPAVREAAVLPRDGAAGRYLAAYVAPHPLAPSPTALPSAGRGGNLEIADLRPWLRERLPEAMVPSAFAVLDRLPLTPNGKVDRRALAAIEPEVEVTGEAPRTAVEEILAGIWSELLGVPAVGRSDGFFDLGGHSLQGTRLMTRVRDTFGVDLPVRALFEKPALCDLAAEIETRLGAGAGDASRIAPLPRDGRPLPLSFAQARLWFLEQLEGSTAFYNVPAAVRLRGPLQPGVFRRALEEVARRHESLRTTFGDEQGRPVQIVAPTILLDLPVVDLEGLPGDAAETEMRRVAGDEIRRPFDLVHGPLLRALIVRFGPTDHAAALALHHIIADGWSMTVLIREVAALYEALAGKRPHPRPLSLLPPTPPPGEGRQAQTGNSVAGLPPLPIQYADFAAWQRERIAGEALASGLAWWRERLAGVPGMTLPTDRPRPPVETFHGRQREIALSPELTRDLQDLARREGVTLFMVLLAVFQTLLSRSTGQTDVPVGSPIANRTRSEVEGLIGFFVNTLVLRTDLEGRPAFRELLGRVRETTLGAYAHEELPFEKLVEEIQPERDTSRNPLFQVMCVLQNQPWPAFRIGELAFAPFLVESGTAKFDLTQFWWEQDGALVGLLEHNSDLYDDATVLRFQRQYEALLREVVEDPSRRVTALPLLDPAERHQLLVEWNGTWTEYTEGQCIHQRV
ncbi:MAG TPA: condensation domain-containing protein, partial [Thermoanaerobaculia bacterium]